jgi:uncharacterized membrane protein
MWFDDDIGCGTLSLVGILILAIIFAGPAIVMTGWNMIVAGMFGGPTISYWAAFWGTWAFHIITERFGTHISKDS